MAAKLIVTDAVIRARNLGFIARANKANTRLWFYTGREREKSTWVPQYQVPIDGGTISLADFQDATR